ncbi:hypothetical protein [Spongiactinospora sp. TRM90649]|uniref:hypothetical protein n=1 Tax=Spongiactinospora sp. TRM90649 TaxID=3031114 RepID=UPI0023F92F35|nr:hypothetical protein [Spongiactinospora sp. TRM90649]MDF5758169.1 hypothetical protein [Spongiactinospora sp. TRM90649]
MSEQPIKPTLADQVPEKDFQTWAGYARTHLHEYIKTLPDRALTRDPFESIAKRLSILAAHVREHDKSEAEGREAFISWVETQYLTREWESFMGYVADKVAVLEKEKVKEEKRSLAGNALVESRRLVGKYSTGPGDKVGTVIAVIAHSGTGKTWWGTSGGYSIAAKQHPVVKEVLKGVHKAEEWEVTACGEVDALNAFLNSGTIAKMSEIPKGVLHFHAVTWNYDKSKWQARGACLNCDQWLKRIGAARL